MTKRLFFALAMLIGLAVRAQVTEFPYTQGFEDGMDGWTASAATSSNTDELGVFSGAAHEGTYSFRFSSYENDYDNNYNQYLISPELDGLAANAEFTFQYATWSGTSLGSSYEERIRVGYSTGGNSTSSFTWSSWINIPEYTEEWQSYTLTLPAGTKYVAINYNSDYAYYVLVDDIVINNGIIPDEPTVTLPATLTVDKNTDITITASYIGSTDGLGFTWTSTMESNGQATMSNEDNVLNINYSASGTDQLTVTATNSYGTSTATATVTIRDCDGISTFPWIESFDNGTVPDCWTLVDYDGDGHNWEIKSSESHNSGFTSLMSASYDNDDDALNPNNFAFTPAISLPADAEGFVLEYWVKANSSTYPEYMSVYIAGSVSPDAVMSSTAAESFSIGNTSWVKHSINLDQYAGQTIYIVFRHHNASDQWEFYLDDVTVRQTGAPVVSLAGPTSLQNGQSGTYVITLTEGQAAAYEWTSTMYEAGLATYTLNDAADTAVFTYSAGGTDTITVTATNDVGTATVTRVVTVIDCLAPVALPWTATLNNATGVQCWLFVDNDGNNYNWSRSGNGNNAYLQSRGADDWAITPPIQMAANAEGTIVEWSVRGYNGCTYEVWVSPTGGTDIEDFTDSLFAETYTSNSYANRSASLAAYDGQTVRVAFRHTHAGTNNNQIRLRSIGVRQTGVPVVAISGPTQIDVSDSPTYIATLSEGSDDGLTYAWSSSMATAGLATLTDLGDSIQMAYTAGGLDTIRVTATNSYGSATATRVVTVVDLSPVTEFPYTTGFESGEDQNWQFVGPNSGNKWVLGQAAANGGTTGLYVSQNNGTANTYSSSATRHIYAYRVFSFSEAAEYAISYDWRCYGEINANTSYDYLRVVVAPLSAAPQNATSISNLDYSSTPANFMAVDGGAALGNQQTWTTASHTFTITNPGSYIVLFYWTNDDDQTNNPPAAIDNISIAVNSCPAPVGLAVDAVSDDSFTVSWTPLGEETSWSVTVGGQEAEVVTATSFSASGLSANTDYTVQVRAICADDEMSLPATITVRTPCGTADFPFSEDFSSAANFDCWTVLDLDGNSNYWQVAGGVAHTSYNSSTNANDWLITPPVAIPATATQAALHWDAMGDEFLSNQTHLTVRLSTTTADVDAFTVLLSSDTLANQVTNHYSVSLADYAGETVYIAFIHDSYNDDGPTIDNVVLDNSGSNNNPGDDPGDNPGDDPGDDPQPEVCDAPTDLHATATTQTSLTFDWTAGGSEEQWQLEVDGQAQVANAHPYTVSGLQPGTSHSVRVRAVCGSNDYSDWTAAVTATTDEQVGISNFEIQNSEFELYPNPASSEVTVSVNNLEIQNSKFEIVSLNGQVVDQFEIHNSKFTIDLTALPAGVYFVRLQGDAFAATRKLVVTR